MLALAFPRSESSIFFLVVRYFCGCLEALSTYVSSF